MNEIQYTDEDVSLKKRYCLSRSTKEVHIHSQGGEQTFRKELTENPFQVSQFLQTKKKLLNNRFQKEIS